MQNKNLFKILIISLLLSTTVVASQNYEFERLEEDFSQFAFFTGLTSAYSAYSLLAQKDLFTSQIIKNDDSRFKKTMKYGFKTAIIAAAFFAPRLVMRNLMDRSLCLGLRLDPTAQMLQRGLFFN